MVAIVCGTFTEDHYPKGGFCVHHSGEGLEEARALLAVEIGQDRFDPAGDAEFADRKSTRLNSSHIQKSRMPSSA